MPINAVRRASTTQKVTKRLILTITTIINGGAGVIVRFKGIEIGLCAIVDGGFCDDEGQFYPEGLILRCTARQGLDIKF